MKGGVRAFSVAIQQIHVIVSSEARSNLKSGNLFRARTLSRVVSDGHVSLNLTSCSVNRRPQIRGSADSRSVSDALSQLLMFATPTSGDSTPLSLTVETPLTSSAEDSNTNSADDITRKIIQRKKHARQLSATSSASAAASERHDSHHSASISEPPASPTFTMVGHKDQGTVSKLLEASLLLATTGLAWYRYERLPVDANFVTQYFGIFGILVAFTWKSLVFPNVLYEILLPPLVALATFPEHLHLNLVISLAAFPVSPILLKAISLLVLPAYHDTTNHLLLICDVGSSLVTTSLSRTEVFLFGALLLNLLYNAKSIPALYLRTFLYGSFIALWLTSYWVNKIMDLSKQPKPYTKRPANAEELKLKYAGCVLIGYLLFVVGVAATVLSTQLTDLIPSPEPFNSIIFLLHFIFVDNSLLHIGLVIYWGVVVGSAIFFIQYYSLNWSVDVRRKAWHATIVIMFLPAGILMDPAFTKIALAIALTGFLLVEFVRVTTIPPFGKDIHLYILRYMDKRDTCGPIVVSHIFLIVGISIPVFLSSSPAGIICLGMGDAMASIVGKRLGRHRWPGSKKTVEGSLAFVVAVVIGLALFKHLQVYYGSFDLPVFSHDDYIAPQYFGTIGYTPFPSLTLPKMILVGCATSLLEAVGGMNDNVIVPIYMLVMLQII